jgi:hypothetical protein
MAEPKVTREEIDRLISMRRAIDQLQADYDGLLRDVLARLSQAPELQGGDYPGTIDQIFRILGEE